MPVFGIDLAAARAPQCARQDKPEQTCRAWYKSPVWKAIKRHRLSQEPNCRQCAQEGCLIHGDARCSCRASWRSVVAIYGLCEHAKPVLLAPQRPETTSVNGTGALPIALRKTQFASHSDSLDSELSNPSNEAGGESGLGRGRSHWRTRHSANGRRKNVCVSRSERGLLKRSEHCSDSRERGLVSRPKLRLTRPFCANWMSLLPLMTNNHTFNDRPSRVLLAYAL